MTSRSEHLPGQDELDAFEMELRDERDKGLVPIAVASLGISGGGAVTFYPWKDLADIGTPMPPYGYIVQLHGTSRDSRRKRRSPQLVEAVHYSLGERCWLRAISTNRGRPKYAWINAEGRRVS